MKKKPNLKNTTKTYIHSKGSILGLEDAVQMQKYSKTVKCLT